MLSIGEKHVSLTLYGQQYDFDKTAYALWQLSEVFEVKIKQDVEKLRENQKNGKVLKETYEGYTPDGQQKTAYKVLPWLWDNIEEVARMMQNIGPFVSRHFKQYGITLNPNWKAISAPFVAKTEKITEILGQAQSDAFTKTASQLANDYQRAYNQELSRDYGLSFGIISNSFTAHLVYAAQATAKEMKDKERAAEFASSVTGNPMEHLLLAMFNAIYPLYIEKAEPALFQILGEYYSYVVSLIAKELGYDFEQISKSFDIEKSIKVLNTSPVSQETIFKALSKNPSNGGVIGYAIMHDLIDDELIEYAYSATPLFLTRVKNWATNKLLEIYNEGKLFNRPLVNDDNRKIVMGLMAFYKKKKRSLFDCQDWQDILAGAFFPVVGKHLTDFTELAITVASPLDFDAKARAGKQFHFSNEIKQTFVFLHNELYFSGAKTTASFLDLKSPVSISAFDAKVKEINERLSIRSKELAEQDAIRRKEEERAAREKKKKSAIIAIIAGCFFIPIGIVLFAIESFFLGFLELAVGVGGLIFGIKSLKEYKEDFKNNDKAAYDEKERQKQEFWAKNRIKVILITTLSIGLIIFFILLPTVIIPNSDYNNAIDLMNAGQYEAAIDAFEELDGYKDSDKQIENCKAAIKEENYQAAKQLYSSKKYEDAYYAFMVLYDYKDSDTMQTNSAIKVAETALVRKDYEEAISWYRTAGKYEEVYNVKYQYVMSHKNNNDETTYDYLVDLKAAKYKDAATIYSQLYDWKITIVAVNNDPDSTVNMSSISKYDPVYVHFKITGGTPNATIKPYVTYENPEGQTGSYTWSYSCSDGDNLWYGWSEGIYNNPEYGDEGVLTVTFYNSSYSWSRIELASVEIVIGP